MGEIATELRSHTTCPNCWTDFEVDKTKWIAAHESLVGDYRLGAHEPIRFPPTRFAVNGNAIDRAGMECRELACPNCHLRIPRSVLIHRPYFLSIGGTPSCGKSFFLASMIWQLRRTLPHEFSLSFRDSDGECNAIVNRYEERLFFPKDKAALATLEKTQQVGDWYSQVMFDDQTLTLTKPFYFDVVGDTGVSEKSSGSPRSRLLCVYDNAGESFLPGGETVANPVTRHLGRAESWLFCFDPTQDPRFREALLPKTNDEQVRTSPLTYRQDVILNEMINRIRRDAQMKAKQKTDRPLFVVCTKFDAWAPIFSMPELPPWYVRNGRGPAQVDLNAIRKVAVAVRDLLAQHCPEVVALANGFSDRVVFLPASATGRPPIRDPDAVDPRQAYKVPVNEIRPIWCEVPLVMSLYMTNSGLVKGIESK